jgi:HAD superfamily hydrolase (TIGR01549 family)
MKIQAILFDLHHTLTKFREDPIDVVRRISKDCGIDLSQYSEVEIDKAFLEADEWFKQFQIESNVDPHYGGVPEHWIGPNRMMFETLGLDGIDETILLEIEQCFKGKLLEMEDFTDAAKHTVKTLHERGYPIGIVTRRYDDPQFLIAKAKMSKNFSTVHWSAIVGYSKPSPYSLLQAADDIGVNPKLCAYVGNLVDADVVASKRAQMLPILLTWANPDQADLAPEGTLIRSSPLELLNIFHGPNMPVEVT